MRNSFAWLISALIIAAGCNAAMAETKMFRTIPDDAKNLVQFTSEATLESVVGHTSRITGFVNLNLDSVAATQDAQFDVDLNSLDTGNGMRNKDMRKDFLETSKFPAASFKLTRFISTDKPTLALGEAVSAKLEGDFTVHGVTKSYEIPVTLTYPGANTLSVVGDWVVKLADHGITRPELLFMRLAEEQFIHISINLTDSPPTEK
jgi:polyisoprenoid-binding protein YceI